MIKHLNGLSTMYGHLSQISVSNGQAVATGHLIVETKDSTITGSSLRADFDSKHNFIKVSSLHAIHTFKHIISLF